MSDQPKPHLLNDVYDPDSWWAYNEPVWGPNKDGEILGNTVIWIKASDAVVWFRAYHKGTIYDNVSDAGVFFDWAVINWAWRCNWPVREGMSP